MYLINTRYWCVSSAFNYICLVFSIIKYVIIIIMIKKRQNNEKQPHERKIKNRFLPDEQYGIALDNLVKGCTDILLLHPDGKRIFLGKRCVQREYLQLLIIMCCVVLCWCFLYCRPNHYPTYTCCIIYIYTRHVI